MEFREFGVLLFGIALVFSFSISVTSRAQAVSTANDNHVFTGRVVNDAGYGIGGVNVWLTRIFGGQATNIDLLETATSTDPSGAFRVEIVGKEGDAVFLCTSISSNNEKLLLPPFSYVTERDSRLLGQPYVVGKSRQLDVGNVPVLFYFGDFELSIRYRGRLLKRSEWQKVWLELENDKGVWLMGQSIGPDIEPPKVTLQSSTASYSLPEGRYRIKIRSVDFNASSPKIGKVVLGSTKLFDVVRNAEKKIVININRGDGVF